MEKPRNNTVIRKHEHQKRNPKATAFVYTLHDDFVSHMTCDEALSFESACQDDKRAAFLYNSFRGLRAFQHYRWSQGARDILFSPNAGGASDLSEAASFELMRRAFGATLKKTEMDIEYDWIISKRTDYSAHLVGSQRLYGVSVTRAMTYGPIKFGPAEARQLLKKKLRGVLMSSRDVVERDAWHKQVLHIWAQTPETVYFLESEYESLKVDEPDLISNTVVLVTVVSGADWIFNNNNNAHFRQPKFVD